MQSKHSIPGSFSSTKHRRHAVFSVCFARLRSNVVEEVANRFGARLLVTARRDK